MLGVSLKTGDLPALRPKAEGAPPKLVLAIGAGQSNEHSFGAVRQAEDPASRPHVYVFHGDPLSTGDYRTIDQNLPPKQRSDYFTLHPGEMSQSEYRAQHLVDLGYCDDVLLVPCAHGSTGLCVPGQHWYPGPAGGANNGNLFESMIEQANAAHAAARAAFPEHAIEVALFWVQGEDDGNNAVPKATYQARFAEWVEHARARITGAANAIVVQGSMVPERWAGTIGVGATTQAHYDINRAHVGNSLPVAHGGVAGVCYSRGTDLDNIPGNDELHYYPTEHAREQGRRMAATYVRARTAAQGSGPATTSPATQTVEEGNPFSLSLAASSVTHKTFHIVGGADAALFEISDPYTNPRVRMLGDGDVPAVGRYELQVAARDGAGIYGPPQTIALTVEAASMPNDVSFVPSAAAMDTRTLSSGQGSTLTYPARDFVAGLAVVFIWGQTREPSAVTVNGIAALKEVSNGTGAAGTTPYCSIWTAPLASSGSFDVVLTFTGSSANVSVESCSAVGAAQGAVSTATKPPGSVFSPASTTGPLDTPAHGGALAACRASTGATFITWQNGSPTEMFETLVSGAYRASAAGHLGGAGGLIFTPSFASENNTGQAIVAAAWGLAS